VAIKIENNVIQKIKRGQRWSGANAAGVKIVTADFKSLEAVSPRHSEMSVS